MRSHVRNQFMLHSTGDIIFLFSMNSSSDFKPQYFVVFVITSDLFH